MIILYYWPMRFKQSWPTFKIASKWLKKEIRKYEYWIIRIVEYLHIWSILTSNLCLYSTEIDLLKNYELIFLNWYQFRERNFQQILQGLQWKSAKFAYRNEENDNFFLIVQLILFRMCGYLLLFHPKNSFLMPEPFIISFTLYGELLSLRMLPL